MFFKIGVVKHFTIFIRKHLCWNYFLVQFQACRATILLKRDSSTDVFSDICERHLRTAASLLLTIKLVIKVLGICRPSLLNQKHNMGWFLLRRFGDLIRVYSLLIISRNHSNTFKIELQKEKNLSKVKYYGGGYLFCCQDFDSLDRLLSTTQCLIV